MDFIDRAHRDNKPFFAWFNSTRMHIWTRLKPESQGKTGLGLYPVVLVRTCAGHVNNITAMQSGAIAAVRQFGNRACGCRDGDFYKTL